MRKLSRKSINQFVPPLVLMSLLLKDLDNFLTLLSIDVWLEYNWGFVEAAQFQLLVNDVWQLLEIELINSLSFNQ